MVSNETETLRAEVERLTAITKAQARNVSPMAYSEAMRRGDALQRRALRAEAKVARVEALLGNWESNKGTPESEAWTHYVAERVRNALTGDYSSEAQAAE